MGGPVDFSWVITSLGTATDMVKGFMTLRSEAERQQLVIDLQSKILEAQRFAFEAGQMERAVWDDYQDALKEIDRLKDHSAKLALLIRKDGLYFLPDDPDPLCPRCVEVDRQFVHLANPGKNEVLQMHWTCPACDKTFTTGSARDPEPYIESPVQPF
jgi:hypothetical protein